MIKNSILFLSVFLVLLSSAQTPFRNTVKIEFEKTVAVQQLYKELAPEWYEMIKEHLPATSVTYFNFTGDTAKSLYQPGREVRQDPQSFFNGVADKNVVFNDYQTGTTVSQKPVFEETFLVEDSLAKIKWKLTADTRTIAGFECRKAMGILNDSITVFAFYTDEILVTGGPESIHGLPGMILGVGIPRIHTTWFATKVEVFDINMKSVVPATKGKKISRAAMAQSLDKVLRQWGTYGSKMIVNFLI